MKVIHKCCIGLANVWKILCAEISTHGKIHLTFFNYNCSITCTESISIGKHCMFANNLVIIDHDHQIGKEGITGTLISEHIVVEEHVWCGVNATVTKGGILEQELL